MRFWIPLATNFVIVVGIHTEYLNYKCVLCTDRANQTKVSILGSGHKTQSLFKLKTKLFIYLRVQHNKENCDEILAPYNYSTNLSAFSTELGWWRVAGNGEKSLHLMKRMWFVRPPLCIGGRLEAGKLFIKRAPPNVCQQNAWREFLGFSRLSTTWQQTNNFKKGGDHPGEGRCCVMSTEIHSRFF